MGTRGHKARTLCPVEVGVFDILMQETGLERKITILALPPCHPWGNFLDRFFRQPYKRAKAKRTAHEVLGFLSSPFPPPPSPNLAAALRIDKIAELPVTPTRKSCKKMSKKKFEGFGLDF